MTEIAVHAREEHRSLAASAEAVLRAVLVRLAADSAGDLALVLADDAELQRLNLTFRGVDAPTDVLSFAAAPLPAHTPEPACLGDIVISVPFAARSAEAAGRELEREVQLLAVHGLLHLLGHDDATEEAAAEMHRLEIDLGVRPAD